MIQGGDVGAGVVLIQGGFLLGGSGASSDWVAWFAIRFLFFPTGTCCYDRGKDSRWVSNVYYSVWIDYTWTMTRSSKHGKSA